MGPLARRVIERDAITVWVSAASAWEIAIKSRAGRLALTAPLHTWMPEELERNGFLMLSVTIDHASRSRRCQTITSIPSIASSSSRPAPRG